MSVRKSSFHPRGSLAPGSLGLADTLRSPDGLLHRRRSHFKVSLKVLLLLGGLLGAGSCAALQSRPLLIRAWRYRHPPGQLTLPVRGLKTAAIQSSWHARRSGGRRHEGIDLFAEAGTQLQSATRGVVLKIREGGLGGRSVTILGEGPALYYYAHLKRWAPDLKLGSPVGRGQAIGEVGNTGNARHTPSHLHFGIYPVRWGRVRGAVDPAPRLLKGRKGQAKPSSSPSPPRASL